MTLSDSLRQDIEKLINQDKVVLFMKGNRDQPRCGFSARVIEILNSLVNDYETIDILENPELREGIKIYTDWPTIPQLYINGEFIGGCDIITEMHNTGDLHEQLGVAQEEVAIPEILVTDKAREAILGALEDLEDNEVLRLGIDARFEHSLNMAEAQPGDVVVEANGIKFHLDKLSAGRANGLKMDFIDNDGDPTTRAGFDLKNPNMPPEVKDMSVQELKALLNSQESFRLFDTRRPDEWEEDRIEGAEFLGNITTQEIKDLDKNTQIVFQCRSGRRSMEMAKRFRQRGFKNLHNLTGGILAWREAGF